MVKTKSVLLLCCAVVLSSCAPSGPGSASHVQVLELAKGRLGRFVSLVTAGGSLVGIYSDWETTSLYAAQVPIGDRLPDAAPPSQIIDKIDVTPPLAPSFGEHAALSSADTVNVLYLAREGEDKLALKLASRGPTSPNWSLDVIEPPGNPIALVPAQGHAMDVIWAAGGLLDLAYPAPPAASPVTLLSPFTPDARASVLRLAADEGDAQAGGRGFTAYDAVSRMLSFYRWNGSSYDRFEIAGAGAIHSSLVLDDGRLAVFSWDQQSKRLSLVVARPNGAIAERSVVSVSEATTAVALLGVGPHGPSRSNLVFLYDQARRIGGGRVVHELSLLTPGVPGITARGSYRRTVLLSGNDPISDFSAVAANGALYVLVQQGSLKLLRLPLPQ